MTPTPATDHDLVIRVVDSHTGGEPTRVIIGGFPALSGTTVADKRADLVASHPHLCNLIVDEPRGNEAMVAALIVEPDDPMCATGVIFFDRTAVLGMCGHGTIGLVESLRWMGKLHASDVAVETPAGVISARVGLDGSVSIANVPSRRLAASVALDVPGIGSVVGDVAYGGNTFFLVSEPTFDLDRPMSSLLSDAVSILESSHLAGFPDVDHVELFGLPTLDEAHSRNFVLCPSGTYDRSPCGTGTSAKLACLAADGVLAEGDTWIQESITGSRFSATYSWSDPSRSEIAPVITGFASVISTAELLISASEIATAKAGRG